MRRLLSWCSNMRYTLALAFSVIRNYACIWCSKKNMNPFLNKCRQEESTIPSMIEVVLLSMSFEPKLLIISFIRFAILNFLAIALVSSVDLLYSELSRKGFVSASCLFSSLWHCFKIFKRNSRVNSLFSKDFVVKVLAKFTAISCIGQSES